MGIKSLFSIISLVFLFFPSPAFADTPPVINEMLAHPSGSNKEWVELYTNGTDLKNYWIDDDTDFASDTGSSTKKQMTTVIQGSDEHHILYELSSSIFNNDGDTVALFTPDGQLVDQYHYSSDPGVDISIGRTPDATGGFSVLTNATRGSANSVAKPPDTPTPAPTTKPTKAPSPTKTPAASSDSASNGSGSSTDLGSVGVSGRGVATDDEKIGTKGAHPTSILGIATKAAERKKNQPTPEVMVKGSSSNTLPLMLTSFGGLFLLACGILVYLKKRRIWK